MKRQIEVYLLLILLLFVNRVNAQNTQHLDTFQGTWQFNKTLSDLSENPKFSFTKVIVVKLTKDSLFLSSLKFEKRGNNISVSNSEAARYSIDGKQQTRKLTDSTEIIGSFSKISDHLQLKKKQIVASTINPNNWYRKIEETWVLSPDGKTLTLLHTNHVFNQKTYSVKGVYDRMKN